MNRTIKVPRKTKLFNLIMQKERPEYLLNMLCVVRTYVSTYVKIIKNAFVVNTHSRTLAPLDTNRTYRDFLHLALRCETSESKKTKRRLKDKLETKRQTGRVAE